MAYDITFPLSLSKFGPSSVSGVSNYVKEIYSSSSVGEIATLVYIDSGDSDCLGNNGSGCILPDQVEWYNEISAKFRKQQPKIINALAFFHIPLQEYMPLWNSEVCYGTNNDTVSCQALDSGIFEAFKQNGDVRAAFVGHNHGNDFCGSYDKIQLCYGRHTGYGGYGTWERGSRIIELTESPWSFSTWIRFEDGRQELKGVKHVPGPPYQAGCD